MGLLSYSRAGGLGAPQGWLQGGPLCSFSWPLVHVRLGLSSLPPHTFQQWIERVVGWLGKVFLQDGPARPASPEAGNTLRRWRCHVQRFFYRIYASLRIEELFSIIRGWPPAHCSSPPFLGLCPSDLAGSEGHWGLWRPPAWATSAQCLGQGGVVGHQKCPLSSSQPHVCSVLLHHGVGGGGGRWARIGTRMT